MIKGEGTGKDERYYGAQAIFHVLFERKVDPETYEEINEYKNDSLKVLDLSFNSIGGSSNTVGIPSSKLAVQSLCNLLTKKEGNGDLVHLDLS